MDPCLRGLPHVFLILWIFGWAGGQSTISTDASVTNPSLVAGPTSVPPMMSFQSSPASTMLQPSPSVSGGSPLSSSVEPSSPAVQTTADIQAASAPFISTSQNTVSPTSIPTESIIDFSAMSLDSLEPTSIVSTSGTRFSSSGTSEMLSPSPTVPLSTLSPVSSTPTFSSELGEIMRSVLPSDSILSGSISSQRTQTIVPSNMSMQLPSTSAMSMNTTMNPQDMVSPSVGLVLTVSPSVLFSDVAVYSSLEPTETFASLSVLSVSPSVVLSANTNNASVPSSLFESSSSFASHSVSTPLATAVAMPSSATFSNSKSFAVTSSISGTTMQFSQVTQTPVFVVNTMITLSQTETAVSTTQVPSALLTGTYVSSFPSVQSTKGLSNTSVSLSNFPTLETLERSSMSVQPTEVLLPSITSIFNPTPSGAISLDLDDSAMPSTIATSPLVLDSAASSAVVSTPVSLSMATAASSSDFNNFTSTSAAEGVDFSSTPLFATGSTSGLMPSENIVTPTSDITTPSLPGSPLTPTILPTKSTTVISNTEISPTFAVTSSPGPTAGQTSDITTPSLLGFSSLTVQPNKTTVPVVEITPTVAVNSSSGLTAGLTSDISSPSVPGFSLTPSSTILANETTVTVIPSTEISPTFAVNSSPGLTAGLTSDITSPSVSGFSLTPTVQPSKTTGQPVVEVTPTVVVNTSSGLTAGPTSDITSPSVSGFSLTPTVQPSKTTVPVVEVTPTVVMDSSSGLTAGPTSDMTSPSVSGSPLTPSSVMPTTITGIPNTEISPSFAVNSSGLTAGPTSDIITNTSPSVSGFSLTPSPTIQPSKATGLPVVEMTPSVTVNSSSGLTTSVASSAPTADLSAPATSVPSPSYSPSSEVMTTTLGPDLLSSYAMSGLSSSETSLVNPSYVTFTESFTMSLPELSVFATESLYQTPIPSPAMATLPESLPASSALQSLAIPAASLPPSSAVPTAATSQEISQPLSLLTETVSESLPDLETLSFVDFLPSESLQIASTQSLSTRQSSETPSLMPTIYPTESVGLVSSLSPQDVTAFPSTETLSLVLPFTSLQILSPSLQDFTSVPDLETISLADMQFSETVQMSTSPLQMTSVLSIPENPPTIQPSISETFSAFPTISVSAVGIPTPSFEILDTLNVTETVLETATSFLGLSDMLTLPTPTMDLSQFPTVTESQSIQLNMSSVILAPSTPDFTVPLLSDQSVLVSETVTVSMNFSDFLLPSGTLVDFETPPFASVTFSESTVLMSTYGSIQPSQTIFSSPQVSATNLNISESITLYTPTLAAVETLAASKDRTSIIGTESAFSFSVPSLSALLHPSTQLSVITASQPMRTEMISSTLQSEASQLLSSGAVTAPGISTALGSSPLQGSSLVPGTAPAETAVVATGLSSLGSMLQYETTTTQVSEIVTMTSFDVSSFDVFPESSLPSMTAAPSQPSVSAPFLTSAAMVTPSPSVSLEPSGFSGTPVSDLFPSPTVQSSTLTSMFPISGGFEEMGSGLPFSETVTILTTETAVMTSLLQPSPSLLYSFESVSSLETLPVLSPSLMVTPSLELLPTPSYRSEPVSSLLASPINDTLVSLPPSADTSQTITMTLSLQPSPSSSYIIDSFSPLGSSLLPSSSIRKPALQLTPTVSYGPDFVSVSLQLSSTESVPVLESTPVFNGTGEEPTTDMMFSINQTLSVTLTPSISLDIVTTSAALDTAIQPTASVGAVTDTLFMTMFTPEATFALESMSSAPPVVTTSVFSAIEASRTLQSLESSQFLQLESTPSLSISVIPTSASSMSLNLSVPVTAFSSIPTPSFSMDSALFLESTQQFEASGAFVTEVFSDTVSLTLAPSIDLLTSMPLLTSSSQIGTTKPALSPSPQETVTLTSSLVDISLSPIMMTSSLFQESTFFDLLPSPSFLVEASPSVRTETVIRTESVLGSATSMMLPTIIAVSEQSTAGIPSSTLTSLSMASQIPTLVLPSSVQMSSLPLESSQNISSSIAPTSSFMASSPSVTVTTQAPTTQANTTQQPTTDAPTTQANTTQSPTTQAPTTQANTTQPPTTEAPTTQANTTQASTSEAPTPQATPVLPTLLVSLSPLEPSQSIVASSVAPTSSLVASSPSVTVTTQAPTTQAPTTQAPTTQVPTTQTPTTQAPTTQAPTTQAPTSQPSTTQAPTTQAETTFPYVTANLSVELVPTWISTILVIPDSVVITTVQFYFTMEARLARAFAKARQRKAGLDVSRNPILRRKRAATYENVTCQMINATRDNTSGRNDQVTLVYYVMYDGKTVPATDAVADLAQLDNQELALQLGYFVAQTEEYEPVPAPADPMYWIIAAVLGPLFIIIIIVIWLVCCCNRTKRTEMAPDTVGVLQKKGTPRGVVPAEAEKKVMTDTLIPPGSYVVKVPAESGDAPPPLPVRRERPPQPRRASKTKDRRQKSSKRRPSKRQSTEESEDSSFTSVTERSSKPASKKASESMLESDTGDDFPSDAGSKAGLFEHVAKLSAVIEPTPQKPASRAFHSSVHPIKFPPLRTPLVTDRLRESIKENQQLSQSMRQKADIEHWRNKQLQRERSIRRKPSSPRGGYEHVAVGDTKDQRRAYRRAQQQIDNVLEPASQVPAVLEPPRRRRMKRPHKRHGSHDIQGVTSPHDPELAMQFGHQPQGVYRQLNGVPHLGPQPPMPADSEGRSVEDESYTESDPETMPLSQARERIHQLLDEAFSLISPSVPPRNSVAPAPNVTTVQPVQSTPSMATPQYMQPAGNGQVPNGMGGVPTPYMTPQVAYPQDVRTPQGPVPPPAHGRASTAGPRARRRFNGQSGSSSDREPAGEQPLFTRQPTVVFSPEQYQQAAAGRAPAPDPRARTSQAAPASVNMGTPQQPLFVTPVQQKPDGSGGILWSLYNAEDEVARISPTREPASLPGGLDSSPLLSHLQSTPLNRTSSLPSVAPPHHLTPSNTTTFPAPSPIGQPEGASPFLNQPGLRTPGQSAFAPVRSPPGSDQSGAGSNPPSQLDDSRLRPGQDPDADEVDIMSGIRTGDSAQPLIQAIKEELKRLSGKTPVTTL